MLGFPVARSTLCRAMQRLARRAKPTRDALVEALRASPVVYADEKAGRSSGLAVGLHEPALRDTSGPCFEQAASVLGKNYAGTLGVTAFASRKRRYRPASTICCLLPRATGDGHARGGALPTLGQAILRHALALRDRRPVQPAWPARGTPPGEDEPPAARRVTNPANQRFAKHLDAIGTTSLCSSTRADVPAEQDIASPWSPQDLRGGNRTAKGAQAQSIS